jgi:hypothetical protein
VHRPMTMAWFGLLVACVDTPQVTSTSDAEQGTASESESGPPGGSSSDSSSSDSSSDDETDGTESESESETGIDPGSYDPLCGEWTSTLVQADRLNEVWLDGNDLVATGGRSLLERGDGGAWSDYLDFSLDEQIDAYDEVWGPAGDRWVLARGSSPEVGVYHHDGTSLTLHAALLNDDLGSTLLPRELVGRGPDDVWALATPECYCFVPPCECDVTSELLHWDGQSWSPIDTPGPLLDIALTETGVWGVGQNGLVVRYDGSSWTSHGASGMLDHVWALDDDELWVAGKDALLMRRSGGVWTTTELPGPWFGMDIIALEGLAADRVWALDDSHGLWAYDGFEWTLLATLAHAGALAVVEGGDSLIVVGGVGGHIVWQVDTTDGSVTLLHERPQILVHAMIADDVDHMMLSSRVGADATWRVTEGVWEPAYEQLEHHFNALLGPVDAAIGVRDSDDEPNAVWQLGEYSVPLSDPVESGLFYALIESEGQLWVGGQQDGPAKWLPMVYAYDGANWIDHSPPLIDGADLVMHLTAAGGRLFADLPGYAVARIMYRDDDDWVSITNPVPGQFGYADIAATAADRLWATTYTEQSQTQLLTWDGTHWQDAASLYPQLAGQNYWLELVEAGDGRLWLLSSGHVQSENELAYFDGNDWTIVDTPPQLHRFNDHVPKLAASANGLFIYDSAYVWRYAFCASP